MIYIGENMIWLNFWDFLITDLMTSALIIRHGEVFTSPKSMRCNYLSTRQHHGELRQNTVNDWEQKNDNITHKTMNIITY